ncbi:MAG: DUF1573 domain-containing protein [bacterium]|nr:DUF1573 domain-containing protein [bacterium]
MKTFIFIALFGLSAVSAFAILRQSPNIERQEKDSKTEMSLGTIVITPASINFGDIMQTAGFVSTTVMVKNTGTKPLKINRLSTSCGCTTAKMDQSDLAPDDERLLTVTFDPMAHPDQIGALIRVVYLQTSDPNTPETEINVTGNVIQ